MPFYDSGEISRMRSRIADDLRLEPDDSVKSAAEAVIQALDVLNTEITAAELSNQIKRAQKEIEQATENLNAIRGVAK